MWTAPLLLSLLTGLTALSQGPRGGPEEPQGPVAQGPGLSEATGLTEEGAPWELDLAQARALALRGNLDLRLAEETVQQAHFSYMGSFGAFEWRFRGDATYTDAEREVTSSFLSGGARIKSTDENLNLALERPLRAGGTFDVSFRTNTQSTSASIADEDQLTSDELALSFTQPLMRGRGTEYGTADMQEQQVRWQLEVERWRGNRQDILGQVDLAYWDLRAATDDVEVQESAVELGQALLVRRNQELDAGMGTELTVLESQADLAIRREALLAADNLRRQREDALKMLLLGAEDLERWEQRVVTVDVYPEPDEMGEMLGWRRVLSVALAERSELRQAESNVKLAEIGKTRALSERMAGLDLVLRASSQSVDRNWTRAGADTLDWEAPTYSAQLSYDLPIGNTAARSAVDRADSLLRSSWIEWEKARRDVVADVRTAVREVTYRREALLAANQSLGLAARNLEQEEARNREGLSTNYQVLEVQQRYVEALSTQRQSRAEWAKAWVNLLKAQGILDSPVPGTPLFEEAPGQVPDGQPGGPEAGRKTGVVPDGAEAPTDSAETGGL